ncbi:hypothetical protein HDV03_002034 [Kappamyces sp. JEL0829]|nr:hypothetical protein HDV03_002034 [Kappamyces sp. JEL0829]
MNIGRKRVVSLTEPSVRAAKKSGSFYRSKSCYPACGEHSGLVSIPASSVAAIVGRNPFKSKDDVLLELWKKFDPHNPLIQTRDDAEQEVLKQAEAATQTAINRAVAAAATAGSANEVGVILETVLDKVVQDRRVSKSNMDLMIKTVTSRIQTTHGSYAEAATAQTLRAHGLSLTSDQRLHSQHLCTFGNVEYVVVGTIDALEICPSGTRTLVEIKNRSRKLFRRVPIYEWIQVQTYLQLLGLESAKLVEQCNGEFLMHNVQRDRHEWESFIQPALEEFCAEFYGKAQLYTGDDQCDSVRDSFGKDPE